MLHRYVKLKAANFELSRHVHAVQNLGLDPLDLRAARAPSRSDANAFEHDDFLLYYFSYSLGVRLTADADNPHYWVALPITVAPTGAIRLCAGAGRVASPTRDDPLVLQGGAQSLGLCIKHAALMRFAEPYLGDDGLSPIVFDHRFDISRPAFRAVGQLVAMIVQEERSNPELFKDAVRLAAFRDSVIATLLHFCAHSHSSRLRDAGAAPAPRDVRRVIDYIRTVPDAALNLSDLVAVADVPGRTLNEHFRAHTGLSPMAYVKRVRLMRARRLMQSGDAASVTEAALASGISHLGRFALDYRALFGERPSDTLARGRRH